MQCGLERRNRPKPSTRRGSGPKAWAATRRSGSRTSATRPGSPCILTTTCARALRHWSSTTWTRSQCSTTTSAFSAWSPRSTSPGSWPTRLSTTIRSGTSDHTAVGPVRRAKADRPDDHEPGGPTRTVRVASARARRCGLRSGGVCRTGGGRRLRGAGADRRCTSRRSRG
jgi:hypothetical protein